MARADVLHEGDRVFIEVRTSYTDRDRMTQLPGATYRKATESWRLPLTWAACLQLRGVFGPDLEVGEKLEEWAWNERNERLGPAVSLREAMSLEDVNEWNEKLIAALDDVERGSSLRLKDFQRAAVAYLVTMRRAGLFDSMGTGKTPTLIRTLQVMHQLEMKPFPVLVICPNSLKHTVWQRELALWAPELEVRVVDGSAGQRRKQILGDDCCLGYDVAVINWDAVRLHSRLAPYGPVRLTDRQKEVKELNRVGYRAVIVDEAHRQRSVGTRQERLDDGTSITVPSSQQALAVWAVAHQAEHRFALTGTPVNDHVGDLWGLLHTIEPRWFPAKTRYLDRYAQTSFGLFGGLQVTGLRPDTEPEFRAITEPLYRRVPKELALPQLPPKLPVAYRETPMSPKQRVAYRQMEKTMLAQLNELLVAPNPLSQLTRLLQFASASAEVNENGKVRLSSPSTKVDDVVELLDELGDEPLVVAAVSRQLVELVAERLKKEQVSHGMVTGAVPPFDRGEVVRRFQEGHLRVVLLTLGAGAEGITLTRANHMLFMQRDWSPLVNSQGEDRIHRIGSEVHDFVQVIHQVTPGTVEERRNEVLAGKEARIEEVVRDREVLARLLGGKE